ncbi:MAG: hypothetical protein U0326_22485 [Polyangiales bacterium]
MLPQNVFPPLVQWTPHHTARADDVYRVRLTRPHATIEAYVRANTPGFNHSWRPTADAWRSIAQSDLTAPITLTVAVMSAGAQRESEARVFGTVDAVIAGSVYYWSPSASRLRRIDVGEARRVDFLPNPGDTCIGCHSVSRDGRHLAGFLEGSGEALALYDLTRDLTARPAPVDARLPAPVRRCTSYNADGTRSCPATAARTLFAMPFTLDTTARRPTATGSSGNGFDLLEWSPDGQLIAFTNRSDASVTAALGSDRFGATTCSTRRFMADATMRARPAPHVDARQPLDRLSARREPSHGDGPRTLWLVARDGGAPLRLNNANNGAAGKVQPVRSSRPSTRAGTSGCSSPPRAPTETCPRACAARSRSGSPRSATDRWRGATLRRSRTTSTGRSRDGALALGAAAPTATRGDGRRDCRGSACEPDSAGANTCVTPRSMCISRMAAAGETRSAGKGLVCTNALRPASAAIT